MHIKCRSIRKKKNGTTTQQPTMECITGTKDHVSLHIYALLKAHQTSFMQLKEIWVMLSLFANRTKDNMYNGDKRRQKRENESAKRMENDAIASI